MMSDKEMKRKIAVMAAVSGTVMAFAFWIRRKRKA